MCKFNHPVLAEIKGCVGFVSYCTWAEIKGCVGFVSYCTWAEIPIHYQNYHEPSHPPFLVHKMGNRLDFLVTTFKLYFMSVLLDLLGTRVVQTGPGAHPASCTVDTGYFPGVKRPGRDADHTPPSSAEVRKG
jgi:hypothetical protein